MRKPRALAIMAAVALGIAGCGTATAAKPPLAANPVGHVPGVSPRLYGAADMTFGLGVLGAWCQGQPSANIVFSPASLATGLGLAYLGARWATPFSASQTAAGRFSAASGGTATARFMHGFGYRYAMDRLR
jgi:serpin B